MKFKNRDLSFWFLISIAILLIIIFIIGQSFALINHSLLVDLGLQESADEVTPLGVVWAKGFALADTLIYIPLFIVGIYGLLKDKKWGIYSMLGALAITIYWPIIHLYMIYAGKNLINLNAGKHLSYSIILPLIIIYGIWGIWFLYRKYK